MPRIGNTHMTVEQADAVFRRMLELKLQIMRVEVPAEEQVNAIRESVQRQTAPAAAELEALEKQLSAFVLAHPEQFEKPRMRQLDIGEYGRRSSTRLVVDNPEALIQHAKQCGYTDMYQVEEKPVTKPIKNRLARGEQIPGVHLETGDTARYKFDPAVLEQEL